MEDIDATGSSVAVLAISAGADGVTTARNESGAIVTARGSARSDQGGSGAVVAYGKQVRVREVVVGARSSRRATVAAMNFGLGPRTKAIYRGCVG